MKHLSISKKITVILLGLLLMLSLSFCHLSKNCCKGFKGEYTSEQSILLQQRDHFILKDSIIKWTNRYNERKDLFCKGGLPVPGRFFDSTSSFNRCIIKAILCNDSCIGLRVLYGMDHFYKVHIIIVGIKPDYSNLYIPRPLACKPKFHTWQPFPDEGMGGNEYGGAEFSQKP